jgi:hypothetical protein
MFKVEIFSDNEWRLESFHNNHDNALNIAEVMVSSRDCRARIIENGKIVTEIQKEGL